ncbi:MAG: hypothetical protein IKB28_02300 [Clostridia bacterium]|nr:hypothetical protein [Clostridia bacterium]
MKKSNKKTPIVFYVGILLACLTLVSIHMTSGLYARYTTSASGQDSARVARFEVTETLQVIKADGTTESTFVVGDVLRPGVSTTYTFTVKNNSEVAVSLTVQNTKYTIKNTSTDTSRISDTRYEELPILVSGEAVVLQPGETRDVKFYLTWDSAKTDPSYGYMIDMVELTVIVQQVD